MALGKNTKRIQITLNKDKHHDNVILNFLEYCYDPNSKIKELLYNAIVAQGVTPIQTVSNSDERLLTMCNHEKQEATESNSKQEVEIVSNDKEPLVTESNDKIQSQNSKMNFDELITEEEVEAKEDVNNNGFDLNSIMDSMNQFMK